MSAVEYDLDTSGGMMPEIQALIAPPVSEEPVKKSRKCKKRELGQSYKRHGRAVNHDYCDSCRESGNLLCCDRCPASFHLECLDPPLDEDDLPSGEWMCHRCTVSPRDFDDDRMSISSDLSSGKNSHISDNLEAMDCDKIDGNQDCAISGSKDYDKERELAVGVALRKGRRQCTIQKKKPDPLVVREATMPANNNHNTTVSKSGVKPINVELEDDETPLQTLIKVASIMNPHQFQLPPELTCTTHLPGTSKRIKARDSKQRKSPYELDNGLVPLPFKFCYECGRSCKKAPLLKCDYCSLVFHLDCLNPPLTVMPVGRWMCPNHAEHMIDQKLLKSVSVSERVKLWNKFSSDLSQDAIKIQFLKKVHRQNPPFRYKIQTPPKTRVKVPNAIKEQYKFPPPLLPRSSDRISIQNHSTCTNSNYTNDKDLTKEHEEWLKGVISLQCSFANRLKSKPKENIENQEEVKSQVNNDEIMEVSDTMCKDECVPLKIDSLDSDLLKKKSDSISEAILATTDTTTAKSLPNDIDMSKIDENMIKILAMERLKQLFPTESSKESSKSTNSSATDKNLSCEVKARAVLASLTIKDMPCYMRYRSLTIGSGANADLCLMSYGHCNYISGKHAVIFYDETTKHYELLNYSEHGTTVDNVLYSCDFSEKRPPPSIQPNTIVASVRSIIDKARGKKKSSPVKSRPLSMNSCADQKYKPCQCKTSASNLIGGSGAGWEGTALLNQGSYIKCGCLQFIFSILDGSPNCYISTDDSKFQMKSY